MSESMVATSTSKALIEAGLPTLQSMVKCESREQFGNLTYVIGGKEYDIAANEWIYAPAT